MRVEGLRAIREGPREETKLVGGSGKRERQTGVLLLALLHISYLLCITFLADYMNI